MRSSGAFDSLIRQSLMDWRAARAENLERRLAQFGGWVVARLAAGEPLDEAQVCARAESLRLLLVIDGERYQVAPGIEEGNP